MRLRLHVVDFAVHGRTPTTCFDGVLITSRDGMEVDIGLGLWANRFSFTTVAFNEIN